MRGSNFIILRRKGKKKMKCKCGNDKFYAHQVLRVDVITDEFGDFEENLYDDLKGCIYDAEAPYGPFICTQCGAEYEYLG